MLQTFLLSMAEITLTMSVLILLLLLFTRLFGARYTARCRYIMWIVVILRLCIPMGTPFVPALLEIPVPDGAVQTELLDTTEPDSADVSTPIDPAGTGEPVFPSVDTPTLPSSDPLQSVPGPSADPEDPYGTEQQNAKNPWLLPVLLWASVAVILFSTRLIGYLTISRRLRKGLLHPTEMQTDLCKRLGIRQGLREKNIPKLYITREVHSPMLCGFWKPIILLPDIPLTDNQLTGVLAHELTDRKSVV